jgi:hypothetical protein
MTRHRIAKGVILILATAAGLYAFAQRRDRGANTEVKPKIESDVAAVRMAQSPLHQKILERIPLR